MQLVRIHKVRSIGGRRVELTLTNGQIIQRDLGPLLIGKAFEGILEDDTLFAAVHVEAGGLAWPGGADLCPDMVLWGGLPAEGPVPEELGALAIG